jgi:hypothetical protein
MTVTDQGLVAGDSGQLALPEYLKPQPGNHPPLDYPAYESTGLRHPRQPLVLGVTDRGSCRGRTWPASLGHGVVPPCLARYCRI